MGNADRVLVCSSPSYDFAPGSVPANVRYIGPQLDDTADETPGNPWADPSGRPLVLVGLSSTVMRQERLLQRAADALGQLPVRGLVTTGPAVDPAVIAAPPNVTVTRWVRHADVLAHCSAVITHGGHGTVMKALIAWVPLIVVPLGRDQPDNAARVVYAGAGANVSLMMEQGMREGSGQPVVVYIGGDGPLATRGTPGLAVHVGRPRGEPAACHWFPDQRSAVELLTRLAFSWSMSAPAQ